MALLRRGSSIQRVFLIVLRGAWGAALVLVPDDLVGGSERSVKLAGARLLGVRHLAEAALMARRPTTPPPRWSIAVDALHGLSMLALAALSRKLRGVALRSAADAFALVALSTYERSSAGAVASSDASAVATSRG